MALGELVVANKEGNLNWKMDNLISSLGVRPQKQPTVSNKRISLEGQKAAKYPKKQVPVPKKKESPISVLKHKDIRELMRVRSSGPKLQYNLTEGARRVLQYKAKRQNNPFSQVLPGKDSVPLLEFDQWTSWVPSFPPQEQEQQQQQQQRKIEPAMSSPAVLLNEFRRPNYTQRSNNENNNNYRGRMLFQPDEITQPPPEWLQQEIEE